MEGEALVPLQLPSGARILARRPAPAMLGAWGLLLNTQDEAARMFLKGRALQDAETSNFMQAARKLLVFCYAEPKISLEPGAGEIHPREIPLEDLRFILRWALRMNGSEFTEFDKGLLKQFGIEAGPERPACTRGL
jgi:hypothetical protein